MRVLRKSNRGTSPEGRRPPRSAGRPKPLTQISARVPDDLKSRFDELVERMGLRKEFVIEEALRHHLRALEDIPAEYILPTRIVLTAASSRSLVAALEKPAGPSQELTALVRGDRKPGDH